MCSSSDFVFNPANELTVKPPKQGETIDLAQIIHEAPDRSIIKLESGEYLIEKAIKCNKPLMLIGGGIGTTKIKGIGLSELLVFASQGVFELEGISFITESEEPTTAVRIQAGDARVRRCSFSGGVSNGDKDFGAGLEVSGRTDVVIEFCKFEDNSEGGLSISGTTKGMVRKNSFAGNDCGLAVEGTADIEVIENYFTKNHVGLGYDSDGTGLATQNTFKRNRGGVLVRGRGTPTIKQNFLIENDAAFLLAEKSDVLIEENSISGGELGIKAVNEAKVKIHKNQFKQATWGVYCSGKSTVSIIENSFTEFGNFGVFAEEESTVVIKGNVFFQNQAACKFTDDVKFELVENKIIDNALYGVLAKSKTKGVIQKNFFEGNGNWNVDIRETHKVKYDESDLPTPYAKNLVPIEYELPTVASIPVEFELQGDTVIVLPSKSDEVVAFEQILDQVKPGQSIVLKSGDYQISTPIIINKSIKILTEPNGSVRIKGEEISELLVVAGEVELRIDNIHFVMEGSKRSNIIVVNSGKIFIEGCSFEGADDTERQKRDFGAGVLLLNQSIAQISRSIFSENYLGIAMQDKSFAIVKASEFTGNVYGVILRDESKGDLSGNSYTSNSNYGVLAYDDSTICIARDICHDSGAGFGCIGRAKGTYEYCESHDSEMHGFFTDGEAACSITHCVSKDNGYSGIALYGDSHTVVSNNELQDNERAGIELGESASAEICGNKIERNSQGIFLYQASTAVITGNDILCNETGIRIEQSSSVNAEKNKISHCSNRAISTTSEKESIFGENVFEDNVENDDDAEEDHGFTSYYGGSSFGDIFAQMLGSENLSDDPSTAVIPLPFGTFAMLDDEDEDEDDESDDEQTSEDGSGEGTQE